MHRSQSVGSQLCQDRVNQRNYTTHRQRLVKTKPSIDNTAPKMYPHLYQKLKKAQVEEERCAEIERDNRTLVKRMTGIMQRSGIDDGKPAGVVSSLNGIKRKNEMARITSENHALLKRIQDRKPTYDHLQWEQDRDRNEQLCERISKYPYRPHGTKTMGAENYESEALPPIEDRPASQQ